MKLNNRIVTYSLILVAAFIIGWWGFQAIQQYSNPLVPEVQETGEETPQVMSYRGQGAYTRIASHLELDSLQKDQFRKLEYTYRQSLASLNNQALQLESEILAELSKTAPDTSKLNQLAIRTGQIKTETRQLTITHFMQLKALCNPQQAEKLTELFIEMEHRQGMQRGQGSGVERQGRRGQRSGVERRGFQRTRSN